MVNLTDHYNTTKGLLDKGEVESERRTYLGMSALGDTCERQLWYNFRFAFTDSYPQRMRRLFNRGHREEPVIIEDLARIGIECLSTQETYVDVSGHIKGHSDGTLIGVIEAPKTKHLAEFKTMSDKYFKDVVKKGVRASKPGYYGQMQLYMHFGKLKRALFIAVNKNDDSYHVERIHYDKDFAEELLRKGHSILLAESPPARPYPTRTFYKCKFCRASAMCWDNSPMNKSCRSCNKIELCNEGKWECSLTGNELTKAEQIAACDKYEAITNE